MNPNEEQPAAFSLLHPHLQQLVHDRRWAGLNEIQNLAVPLLVEPGPDVLISAGTASGKTEAAMLGIVTNLLSSPEAVPGVNVLYLAPTVALINDQHERITTLSFGTDLVVTKWHGSAPAGPKRRLLQHPTGVLQTTPESLEAMFSRRGTEHVIRLFGDLRYTVIDELHSFPGTERGAHLFSLLSRIEQTIGRRTVRVGLSATLGDVDAAAAELRSDAGEAVELVIAGTAAKPLSVTVHGYLDRGEDNQPPGFELAGFDQEQDRVVGESPPPGNADMPPRSVTWAICQQLFATMSTGKHLVFPNSRRRVEEVADILHRLSKDAGLGETFYAHHSNIAPESREHIESRLKDPDVPTTAVCSPTLEMGVDLPGVESVAQLGAPPSVAGLGQRAGRSGRRGGPRILEVHCAEAEITPLTNLGGQLREGLVQSIAMVELLQEGWCEPPVVGLLHTSTLVQQLLSVIAERGGVRPADAYRVLCSRTGPFASTTKERFGRLLRALGKNEILTQVGDLLILGPKGEQIVASRDFYAVFPTPVDYRLRNGSKPIGTLPLSGLLPVDTVLIFGGRPWRVTKVSYRRKVIDLVPSPGGRAPAFSGELPQVHDVVRTRMRTVLAGSYNPGFLDDPAATLLIEGRDNFAAYGLATRSLLLQGHRTVILPWVGNRTNYTVALLLRNNGISCTDDGLVITCKASGVQLVAAMNEIVSSDPVDPLALARPLRGKATNKYDQWLDNELLSEDYAVRAFNVSAAYDVLWRLLSEATAMQLQ